METRLLGNSDMKITRIGLGTWAIGGEWAYGWGPQEEKESIATIHKALDGGINWIDTAAAYGIGNSERAVGKAVKERKDRPYIFTKCSLVWDAEGNITNVLKADSVRREAESSLKRLGVEAIDLYQIHWPSPEADIEEGWQALARLREEGKVRYIGISNFNVPQMKRIRPIAPITSLQPPFSLIRRGVEEEILPYCQAQDIGVIVYSPMASGLLSGKMTVERVASMADTDWRKKSKEFQAPRLSHHLELAERLRSVGESYGRTAAEVAIAWTLLNPAVTGAIVGMRKTDQVEGVIHGADLELSKEDLSRIES
jgi:aryl-alcohol dehydrogenase-like predicted oxidoreductase